MIKKLSICMIVKDEEKNLRRCLDSLKPLLEITYTELIIVDTGSTDGTIDIAKEFTDKVYFHEWNGNFSDMRNISISYASGEWIFIIDADEELETPLELISLIESPKVNNYNTIRISEKNLLSIKLNKYVYHIQERLFKNDGTFQYKGTIHNQPVYKHPILIEENIRLMHYGYINEDKDLMEKKFKRTASALKKELEKNPEYVYYRFQLARSYMMHGDDAIALEEITKAYQSMKKQPKELIIHRYYVYGEFARMSLNAKKFEQVIEICKEGLSYNQNYIDLYYYMGHALIELEEFNSGIEILSRYIELYIQYNRKEIDLSNFTAVEMYTVDQNTFYRTVERVTSLIYKYPSLNSDLNQYSYYINQIDNKFLKIKLSTKLLILEGKFDGIIELYKELDNKQRYIFVNYIEFLKINLNKEHIEKLEYLFAHNIYDDYGLLNRIRITKENSKLLLEFINEYDVIKFSDQIIIEFAKHLLEKKYLIRFFKKLDNLTIKKIVKKLIDEEEKLDYFTSCLRNDFMYNDFQNNRIFITISNVLLLSEEEVANKESRMINFETFDIFERYIDLGISYVQTLYNLDILRLTYKMLLPKEDTLFVGVHFALESIKIGNIRDAFRYYREVVSQYPFLSKYLKEYLSNIYIFIALSYKERESYIDAIEMYEEALLKTENENKQREKINAIQEIENQLIKKMKY